MLLLLFLIFIIIMNHESWRWVTITRTSWELRAAGDWFDSFIGLRTHSFNIQHSTTNFVHVFIKVDFSTRSQTNYNPNFSIFRHKKLQQAECSMYNITDFSSSIMYCIIQRIYFINELVDEGKFGKKSIQLLNFLLGFGETKNNRWPT